jgi:hypothetical protein
MDVQEQQTPARRSLLSTTLLFAAGAVVTSFFSGSLAAIAPQAQLHEVLTAGMIIPSFTWLVQLTASALGLNAVDRDAYWHSLGQTCLIGSVVLLPAAIINLVAPHASLWISVENVLVSVAIMATFLFRSTSRHNIARIWPTSWCLTIATNMAIFVWWSWRWWW